MGSDDGVEVRNILGAVANETGLRSRFIGQIRIHPRYSTIELPDDLPHNMLEHLRRVYVGQQALRISRARYEDQEPAGRPAAPPVQAKVLKNRKTTPAGGRKKPAKGKTRGKAKP